MLSRSETAGKFGGYFACSSSLTFSFGINALIFFFLQFPEHTISHFQIMLPGVSTWSKYCKSDWFWNNSYGQSLKSHFLPIRSVGLYFKNRHTKHENNLVGRENEEEETANLTINILVLDSGFARLILLLPCKFPFGKKPKMSWVPA